ncbi:hypothetical protein R4Z10_07140 [Niallia sp. XMNu-256]|uniref:hypothetical protein n=1 Tax=Niallia sp. XMNu-256 TaxID=3082444 RepID=UPI0030CFBB7D
MARDDNKNVHSEKSILDSIQNDDQAAFELVQHNAERRENAEKVDPTHVTEDTNSNRANQ